MEVNLNCESDTRPNKFEIENILDGKCDVVINDNITEITETVIDENEEETTKIKYSYDTYRISKNYRDNLENELENETVFNQWLSDLKAKFYDLKAEEVRQVRNELLKESDAEMCLDRMGLIMPEGTSFTAWISFLKSLGNAVTGNMARYRQELRDITKQPGFPFNVVFPEKPSTKDESEV